MTDLLCWEEGLCNGVLLGQVNGLGRNACLAKCQEDKDCLWFTHDSYGMVCMLLGGCHQLDRSFHTSLSSQRQCSRGKEVKTGLTKLIVIGGYNDRDDYQVGELNSVEVIDLEDPTSVCAAPASSPMEGGGMQVAVMDGKVKVCGNSEPTNDCYDYYPASDTWLTAAGMMYERNGHRSSVIGDAWLVSGADYNNGAYASDTEFFAGVGFVRGPNMAHDMEFHCQLTVNATHVFFSSPTVGTSDLLDWYSQTWTDLEPMPDTFNGGLLSCGLIDNPEKGLEAVMSGPDDTWIFNFESLTWRAGPKFPMEEVWSPGYAQLVDTFVVVGGEDDKENEPMDTIYQFDHLNYEWVLLEQRLGTRRQGRPGVVAVTADFIACNS